MSFPEKLEDRRFSASSVANASWMPVKQEEDALERRQFLEKINQVDQIWDVLAQDFPDLLAVHAPHSPHQECFTYAELAQRIETIAKGLDQVGIKSGDVVAVFAENSPRWLIADQAIMRLGGCNAVRGTATPAEELKYILNDSRSVALFIQNSLIWKKLALNEDQLRQLKVVIQLEGSADDGVLSWDSLLNLGQDSSNDLVRTFNADNPRESSQIATIIYTSGTTGRPKGVPLSHSNLLHQIKSLACIANPSPGSPVLSVLPIWHAYERSAEYYFFSCGCSQTYTTIKNLKEDLSKVRPVVMATVPRLWEAIQLGFEDVVCQMPPFRRSIIRLALLNSTNYKASLREAKELVIERIPTINRIQSWLEVFCRWPLHSLSAWLLWPKIVNRLSGGRLEYPINGGGAIAPHVDSFFEALGIELLVGYGLTETSPVVSCRRPWQNIRGSSGSPLPDTEFKIVDPETGIQKSFREQGKIFVKGPQVMIGYLRKPDATEKVLDSKGWFDTGDLGMLLPNGNLVITGRAKDTIVLSNGENIEPGPLEEFLVKSVLFEQVMVIGQDEKQLGLLLVPQKEAVLDWVKSRNITLLSNLELPPGDFALRKLLKQEVNTLLAQRKGSRNNERVIGVACVEAFTIDNGLLTQTLKQKRAEIVKRNLEFIDLIYSR